MPVWIAQRDGGILADPQPPIFAVAAEAEYPARAIRRTRDEIEAAAVIQRTLPLHRAADLDLRELVHWTRHGRTPYTTSLRLSLQI